MYIYQFIHVGTQVASTQCWRVAQALRSHIADVDSLTLLTRCLRASLVYELLQWLTVGWSWVTNRAVRPERSWRLLSYVYFCGDVDNKNGRTYQKAKFVDKKLSSQYNRFSCFLLQVPQTFSRLRPLNNVVLFTTITCRFNIRPYFLQNISSTVVCDVIS